MLTGLATLGAHRRFFDAMLQIWALDSPGVQPKERNGQYEIEIQFPYGADHYRYVFVDRWYWSPTGKTAGTSTIIYGSWPVWFMSYGGFYREQEIPFLKRALHAAYSDRIFRCGRGPECFVDPDFPDLRYENSVTKNGFEDFSGREAVLARDGTGFIEVGYYSLWGMGLV